MPASTPPSVLRWLLQSEARPVDPDWVPGANEAERRALAALGGLARELTRQAGWEPDSAEIARWLSNGPEVPAEIVEAATVALREDGDGSLAALYAQLVRSSHRRQLGTFFTPVNEVEYIVRLWADEHGAPEAVVDVGAGVGVFTAAATTAWPRSTVFAIDINPVTLGLLGVRLFSDAGRDQPGPDVRLVLDDFSTWVGGEQFERPGESRLILGNPPYTRARLISPAERTRLNELTDGLCGVRASLSTIITAISIKHLRPDDGLCLLLPAHWLESDYARGLRSKIWGLSRRVELRLVESAMFEDAQVDAVVLMIGPETSAEEMPAFVVGSWKDATSTSLPRTNEAPRNWRSMFGPEPVLHTDRAMCLEDVATVRRGVATGNNAFFVLSERTRDESGLPAAGLRPVVTRLRDLPEVLEREPDRWLIAATSSDRKHDEKLDAYLTRGEKSGVDEGYLCAQRDTWYDLTEEVSVPDVIVGSMTRDVFRFVENRTTATITNNLYGWTWKPEVGRSERTRILTWLRSDEGQEALASAARRQGEGLLKIEPRALRTMGIPVALSASDG